MCYYNEAPLVFKATTLSLFKSGSKHTPYGKTTHSVNPAVTRDFVFLFKTGKQPPCSLPLIIHITICIVLFRPLQSDPACLGMKQKGARNLPKKRGWAQLQSLLSFETKGYFCLTTVATLKEEAGSWASTLASGDTPKEMPVFPVQNHFTHHPKSFLWANVHSYS